MQSPVHERHLELVLEVAHRPQPPDDHLRADPLRELGEAFARLPEQVVVVRVAEVSDSGKVLMNVLP